MEQEWNQLPKMLCELSYKLKKIREKGNLLIQNGDRGFGSAPSNIALIKYWGKEGLQIPLNSSLSMTLGSFRTNTCITASSRFSPDVESAPTTLLKLNGKFAPAQKLNQWIALLRHGWADEIGFAVESENSFPTACGVASSASAYAALVASLADLLQLKKHFTPEELQYWLVEWARLGSGSATRSAVFDAEYVAWDRLGANECATRKMTSTLKLSHCLLVVDSNEKEVGSSAGHQAAVSSLLHPLRLARIPLEMAKMERALAEGDFFTLAACAEADAFALHAVMQSSQPKLSYFGADTAAILSRFIAIRNSKNAAAFWTLDAGPNPHFLFTDINFMRLFLEEVCEEYPKLRVIWNTSNCGICIGRG